MGKLGVRKDDSDSDEIQILDIRSYFKKERETVQTTAKLSAINKNQKDKTPGQGTDTGKFKERLKLLARAKEAAKRDRNDRSGRCIRCINAKETCEIPNFGRACLRCRAKKTKCVTPSRSKNKGESRDTDSGGSGVAPESGGASSEDDDDDEDTEDSAMLYDPNPLALVGPSRVRQARMFGAPGSSRRMNAQDPNGLPYSTGTQVLRMVADSIDAISAQNQMILHEMKKQGAVLAEVRGLVGERRRKEVKKHGH